MEGEIYKLLGAGANTSNILLVLVVLKHHFQHREHSHKIKTLWDKVFS